MFRLMTTLVALTFAAAPLVACSDDGDGGATTDTTGADTTGDTAAPSVYTQLGEEAGIATFVDGLVAEELKDPTIAPYFAGLGTGGSPTAAQLKACLVQQVGNATGGPQPYPTTVSVDGGWTCRTMAATHAGMNITATDFDTFVSIAAQFAADQGVPSDIIGVLGGFLNAQKDDIVPPQQSIYERLGEEAGIAAFVDGLVAEELKDPSIAPFFAHLGEGDSPTGPQLKACLTKQVAAATGGPQQYPTTVAVDGGFTCRDMVTVHEGLGITGPVFDKFVSIAGMFASDQEVPSDIITVLGGFLVGFKADIVEESP